MKKDWEEIEKFFKLLERDETLDKQLKEFKPASRTGNKKRKREKRGIEKII